MPLHVIGAGFPRTGTHSLKTALNQLGLGPTYHFEEVLFERPEHIEFWRRVQKRKTYRWCEVLHEYGSAVDAPTCIYYRELMSKYPEAKIVLTIRDGSAWYKSYSDTILASAYEPLPSRLKTLATAIVNSKLRRRLPLLVSAQKDIKTVFLPHGQNNTQAAIERFESWNQEVIDTVPKNRLLVFRVADGWEPLCNFLGMDVPDTPFPHTNATADFIGRDVVGKLEEYSR